MEIISKLKKLFVLTVFSVLMLMPISVGATELYTDTDIAEEYTLPRIYDVDWKNIDDKELNILLDEMTDAELTEFLFSLEDDDIYEIIERDTLLAYPVYGADIPLIDTEEAHDVYVLYNHYYEKLFQDAIMPLDWDNDTNNYSGSADGKCYIRIFDQNRNTLARWRIKINGIQSGEYTLNSSQATIEERTAGCNMVITKVKADKKTHTWAGIRIIGSYTLPAHYRTLWESEGESWMGRFDPWNEEYTSYSLDTAHHTNDVTDDFDIQVNGFHWGGIVGTDGGNEGTIILVRHTNKLVVDPNGGSWNGSTSKSEISKLCRETTSIPVPTRSGYRFTGWTLSNGSGANGKLASTAAVATTFTHCINGATFSTSTDVYSNTTATTTIKANWEVSTYKVTVTAGTGISAVSGGGDYYEGNNVKLGATVKTGYTWKNWTGTYSSTTKNYSFTMPKQAVSMTANATPNNYMVRYNPNDPNTSDNYSVSGTMANSSHTYDTAKNLTANAFSHRGYKFAGWNTKADGSGTAYADKASVKNLTSTNGGVVDLYAQWSPITYTITYIGNTNTSGTMSASTHTYDKAKNLTANAFYKMGYLFNEWNTKAAGSGTAYADKASVINLKYTQGANLDLYAQWIPITYTLKYDSNSTRFTEAETTGNGSSTTLTYDVNYTVEKYEGNPNNFNCNTDHYIFTHWDTKSNDTGNDYKPGDNAVNLTTTNNGTVTLYAQYKVQYRVYHYLQDSDGTYPTTPDYTDIDFELADKAVGSSYIKTINGYFAPYANSTNTPANTIASKTITVNVDYKKNEIHYFYPKTDFNVYVDPNTGTWRDSKDETTVNVPVGGKEIIELPVNPYSGTLRIYFDSSLDGEDILVGERPVDKIFDGWTHTGGGEFTGSKTGNSRLDYLQDNTTKQALHSGDAYLKANYVIGYYQLKQSDVPAPREHYKFLGWNVDPTVYPNPEVYDGDDAIYDPDTDAKYRANPNAKVTDYVVGDKIYILEDNTGKTYIYENGVNTWIEANIYEVWRVDFELDTVLTRVLKPDGSDDPGFRAGEAGELYIDTVGFVDEIDITFPGKLNSLDNSLTEHRDIEAKLTDSNSKNFNIPLYAPSGDYTIKITVYSKSYKDPLESEHIIKVRKDTDNPGPPWWEDPTTDSISSDIKTLLK